MLEESYSRTNCYSKGKVPTEEGRSSCVFLIVGSKVGEKEGRGSKLKVESWELFVLKERAYGC